MDSTDEPKKGLVSSGEKFFLTYFARLVAQDKDGWLAVLNSREAYAYELCREQGYNGILILRFNHSVRTPK